MADIIAHADGTSIPYWGFFPGRYWTNTMDWSVRYEPELWGRFDNWPHPSPEAAKKTKDRCFQ